jgi:hypothetical protein
MFRDAGFTEVARSSPSRPVMRLVLSQGAKTRDRHSFRIVATG